MKMKRLCALAVLLTSSLVSAADGVVADLEGNYYAGLNFGVGWGGGFVMKPSVVFGYHHDKNSKFELEALTNMKDIASKDRVIGASLLANYRYYPDLDIDPVKLYVSGGLGGYVQILPEFGFGFAFSPSMPKPTGKVDPQSADNPESKDNSESADNPESEAESDQQGTTVESTSGAIGGTVQGIYGADASGLVKAILGSISYKLKVGVDYEITSQVVGTAGITMGGQLSNFTPPIQIPDAILEVGVRYNF
ncbi:hypothetical protein [Candidatus Wolbachia massiliensis]|uniref:Outer membrane protein beta-barrel domain-containing protein n=1 Tax=Candidatus Wolbachia massiliensis TaxID=1845000 RepID=A0A7M3U2L8_9RICK|nr:hypothetical protein [Candidatus Wolbachia massiliensis]QOD38653.1 hypothetical protein ID128_02155 [Candidatus Wolbachia massiliensis]